MSNQVRPYEPVTSKNAALVLIDHQMGLIMGVRDVSAVGLSRPFGPTIPTAVLFASFNTSS